LNQSAGNRRHVGPRTVDIREKYFFAQRERFVLIDDVSACSSRASIRKKLPRLPLSV
jgi:hypothetical protein